MDTIEVVDTIEFSELIDEAKNLELELTVVPDSKKNELLVPAKDLIKLVPAAKNPSVWDVLVAGNTCDVLGAGDVLAAGNTCDDVFAFEAKPSFKKNASATTKAAAKARLRAKAEAKAEAFAKVCAMRARKKRGRDSKKEKKKTNTAKRASTSSTTAKCNAHKRGRVAKRQLAAETEAGVAAKEDNRKKARAAVAIANKRSAAAAGGRSSKSHFKINEAAAAANRAAVASAAATTAAAVAAAATVPWERPQYEIDYFVRYVASPPFSPPPALAPPPIPSRSSPIFCPCTCAPP